MDLNRAILATVCIIIGMGVMAQSAEPVEYKETGRQGFTIFVYTPATSEEDLLQIAAIYKRKEKSIVIIHYFNDLKKAAKKFPMTDTNMEA